MPDITAPDATSWMDAGAQAQAAQQAFGNTPPPQVRQETAADRALAAAKAPPATQPQAVSPNLGTKNWIGGQVPVMLRPKRAGMLGVMDKIADALTGKTTPEIYTDQDGNEFVYHPNMSRGQQWMRIGAGMFKGAATGLAAGRGAGNMGKAALAGVQVGEEQAQQQQAREEELNTKVQTDMQNRANALMLRMKTAEQAWRAARLQTEADEKDAEASQKMIEFYTKTMGGTVIGQAQSPADLAGVMKVDPQVAQHFVRDHIIEPVPTVDAQGHHGVTFIQMPNANWRNQVVAPGSTFKQFNPAHPDELEEYQAADTMTRGQLADMDRDAYTQQLKFRNDQQELTNRQLQGQKTQQEVSEAKTMAPLKAEEARVNIAKGWAETHKANMEAEAAKDQAGQQQGDTLSEAQALVDGRSAVSLMNRRAKNFMDVMNMADQLSMQQTGHRYDREQGEIAYQSREKLIKDFTDGEEAGSIESFDKFLGHAQEASEAINALRNTDARLLNVPINTIEKWTPSRRGPALQAAMVKFKTLRNEFETTLKNNHALTIEDIREGQKMLDENVSLGMAQDVMRSMANVAAVRLRASDFKYARTMKTHVPDLLSQQGANALQHFGVDPKDAYSTLQNAQQPQGQPAGTAGTMQFTDGKTHYVDATGKDLGVKP